MRLPLSMSGFAAVRTVLDGNTDFRLEFQALERVQVQFWVRFDDVDIILGRERFEAVDQAQPLEVCIDLRYRPL